MRRKTIAARAVEIVNFAHECGVRGFTVELHCSEPYVRGEVWLECETSPYGERRNKVGSFTIWTDASVARSMHVQGVAIPIALASGSIDAAYARTCEKSGYYENDPAEIAKWLEKAAGEIERKRAAQAAFDAASGAT